MIDKNVKELILVVNKIISNIDTLMISDVIIKSKNTKGDYKYVILDHCNDMYKDAKVVLNNTFKITNSKELISFIDIKDNGLYSLLNFEGLNFDDNIEYLLNVSKGLHGSSIIKNIYSSYNITDDIIIKIRDFMSCIHQAVLNLEDM